MCSSGVDLFLVTCSAGRAAAFLHSPCSHCLIINLFFLDSWSDSVSLLYSCGGVLGHWLERLGPQAVCLWVDVKFGKTCAILGQEGRISLVGINASELQRLFPPELCATCLVLSHCPVLEWNWLLPFFVRVVCTNTFSACPFITLNSWSWNLGLPLHLYGRIRGSFAILDYKSCQICEGLELHRALRSF